jgi:hypothetical protein
MGAAAVPILIGATVLSTYASIQASKGQVEAQKAAAKAEAQRAEIAAKNAAAAASVKKAGVQREIDTTLSRAQAVAAATGTSIPPEVFGAIAERGAEQQQFLDWQTRTQGDQIRDAAAINSWQAEAAGKVARTQQIATAIGGAAQAVGFGYKYGGGSGAPRAEIPSFGDQQAGSYP